MPKAPRDTAGHRSPLCHARAQRHAVAVDVDRSRQITPAPGGVIDKGTESKRARAVLLIAEICELAANRVNAASRTPRPAVHRPPRDPNRSIVGRDQLGRGQSLGCGRPGPWCRPVLERLRLGSPRWQLGWQVTWGEARLRTSLGPQPELSEVMIAVSVR